MTEASAPLSVVTKKRLALRKMDKKSINVKGKQGIKLDGGLQKRKEQQFNNGSALRAEGWCLSLAHGTWHVARGWWSPEWLIKFWL